MEYLAWNFKFMDVNEKNHFDLYLNLFNFLFLVRFIITN